MAWTSARHYLRNVRRYRDHLLSEPEEKILAEKALTGASAWTRLFEELTSAIEVELPGSWRGPARAAEGTAAERSRSTSRSAGSRCPTARCAAATAEAVTAALAPGLRTRAFLFNTLLADKATDDRLRRYPHWLAARNLANEASDESVQALIDAVRARYEIPRRWYRLKAGLLGIERLADYDRIAPVTEDEVTFPFARAREIVLDCYSSFSPELGDAGRAASSRSAASTLLCAPPSAAARSARPPCPRCIPYVLLNYTSRRRDVLTLAHELGHGVHFALAAQQGIFHQSTPLTLAETASVFGETIVFGRLLEEDSTPASRLALLAENLEDTIATVFRQVAMNRFEDARAHRAPRAGRALGGALRRAVGRQPGGDAGRLGRADRRLPLLVVLHPSLHRQPRLCLRLRLRPAAGAVGLSALRGAGRGVRTPLPGAARRRRLAQPEELGRIVGIDLTDPGFWDAGLDLVERQLADAEQAAQASGRI